MAGMERKHNVSDILKGGEPMEDKGRKRILKFG
jgi:hypothetical protein